MASFISFSPSSRFYKTPNPNPPLHCNSILPSFSQLKGCKNRRFMVLKVKCVSEQNGDGEESKLELDSKIDRGISTYSWCAALGGIGFLESAYLSLIKFTNLEAFCPVGSGGSCSSVLNSEYSVVFGLPLPLIGMVAYGIVATVGLQLSGKSVPFKINEADGQWLLLVITTSMAVASTYFLYVLNSQFAGEPCLYCFASALLSFSLFLITMKNLGSQEVLRAVGLQLCVASLVVATLNSSYHDIPPVARSSSEIPYFKTEVSTHSTPLAISLAKHLHSAGAKLYGAFWCTHCQEQKEIFGREAAKILDYVECFPDGYKKGTTMVKECTDIKLEGFPTWLINGEVHSGELEFSELAELTGIKLEDLDQSK